MKTQYTVIDEFIVNNAKILVLNKDRDISNAKEMAFSMNGKEYPFKITHTDNWIIVDSSENFKGNKIEIQ